MIKTVKIDTILEGNPYAHDTFRMGTQVGTNVEIMFERHTNEFQPYIIVVNRETGERVRIVFDDEARTMA